MRQLFRISRFLWEIAWRNLKAIGKDNIAFASMDSGESALSGMMVMPRQLKSPITIHSVEMIMNKRQEVKVRD
jgi:hypothetical protein